MTAAQHRRSEPKGQPTPTRNARRGDVARANRRATLQWVLVFAVIGMLVVGLGMFGPSLGGDGPTHRRVPIGGHGG